MLRHTRRPLLLSIPYISLFYNSLYSISSFSRSVLLADAKCSKLNLTLLKWLHVGTWPTKSLCDSLLWCRPGQFKSSRSYFHANVRVLSLCAAFAQRTSPDFSQMPGARKPLKVVDISKSRKLIDNKTAKESLDHCIALTKSRDFANYVAALLLPPVVQPTVFALLAFNVELAVVRDQIKRNTGTAGIYRLQFWKDTVETIYGSNIGPLPRQPVAIALMRFAPNTDLSLLSNLILARQHTLGDRPFSSMETVEEYGRRTYGSLMKMIMDILLKNREKELQMIGKKCRFDFPEDANKAADALGASMAVVTLLRSTVPMLARGVVLLPEDLMNMHGLSADAVYGSKNKEAIKTLAKDMVKVADTLLTKSRSVKDEIPCALRPAMMANGATVDYLLKVFRKCDFNLFDARLQRGYHLLAWRLWIRKTIGRY